jgi:hypothetical protein
VVELGVYLLILIARFLCPLCGRTMSCLPSFAQPYRMMGTATVEAFLQKRMDEPGIAQHWDLLHSYGQRWEQRSPEIEAVTGLFFGPLSDEPPPKRLLGALLSKWGDLQRASVQLLELFGETPLGRYRIHDWARVARGGVDPLRKPPYQDSG